MLAAFITTFFFALSAICATQNARHWGAATANFLRLSIAVIPLFLYAEIWGQGHSGSAFWIFFWSGVIGFGIGDLAYFQSIPRLGSRLALLLMQCFAAPIAVLIEWQWLGTELDWKTLLSGAIILGGIAIALVPSQNLSLS